MSYQKRTPSIKLEIEIETFNSLLERLNIPTEDSEKSMASKLKEKLLNYSVTKTDEVGNTTIDVRFFPNEASFLLKYLLITNIPIEVKTDYYSVLLKVREERRKQEN